MFTNAYQCLPMLTNAYQCLPMFTNAYQSLPMFTNAYQCCSYIYQSSANNSNTLVKYWILAMINICKTLSPLKNIGIDFKNVQTFAKQYKRWC